MTKRFLILEPDRKFGNRMAEALTELHDAEVTVVPNSKDACLHLMQQAQDLALVPMIKSDKLIRSLRAVQPDVRLVVLAPTEDATIPKGYAELVQGVLRKSRLDEELASVLSSALSEPFAIEDEAGTVLEDKEPTLDTAALISILQQAQLGRLIQAAVFAEGSRLLVHWGALEGTQAATVALVAGGEWTDSTYSVRIQFINLPGRAGDMLLYTNRVGEMHYLTMVARPETPLGEVRAQSDALANDLFDTLTGQEELAPTFLSKDADTEDERTSYAIVWRPIQPLPPSLHIPLRRSLARLAVTNNCTLAQIEVRQELVHLVVTCPPGHDSTWAAYLFKNGSEATIQQEFGLVDTLWDKGHHAIQSTHPLSEDELNLFLNRQTSN